MTALLALVSAMAVCLAVLTTGWLLQVLAFSMPAIRGVGGWATRPALPSVRRRNA